MSDYIIPLFYHFPFMDSTLTKGVEEMQTPYYSTEGPSWHGLVLLLHPCPFPLPSHTQIHRWRLLSFCTCSCSLLLPVNSSFWSTVFTRLTVKSFSTPWKLFSCSLVWYSVYTSVSFLYLWVILGRNCVLLFFVWMSNLVAQYTHSGQSLFVEWKN